MTIIEEEGPPNKAALYTQINKLFLLYKYDTTEFMSLYFNWDTYHYYIFSELSFLLLFCSKGNVS